MSTCKGCGQIIIWITMQPSKKANPVNPIFLKHSENLDSDKDPIVVNTKGQAGRLSVLKEGYVSHYSNCPKASFFKKGVKK